MSSAFYREVKIINEAIFNLIGLTTASDEDGARLAGTMIALAASIAKNIGRLTKEDAIKLFERGYNV